MPKGGKRSGAGRPKGAVTDVKARAVAASILAGVGEAQAWKWALDTAKKKKDVKTYVDILKYLTDREHGKPRQAVDVGNDQGRPFEIVSHIPRPDRGNTS